MRRRLRVLLVNQYFPPDTSATAVILGELMDAFVGAGHDVTVICGRPSYDPQQRHPWRLFRRESNGDIHVIRVGSTTFERSSLALRAVNYLTFLFLAALRAALERVDVVVVATDPPLAIAAGAVAARAKPLVYSLRDLHPDAAQAAGWVQEGFVVHLWDSLHTRLMKRAARVVCLGEAMADRVIAKGIDAARVTVIEDGARLPETNAPTPDVVDRLRGGADFVVMHAGNLGAAYDWDLLLEAAEGFAPARLVFVGGGAAADRLRVSGATIHPFLPGSELASVMAAGDVQVVALRRDLAGLVVPSKLFTALAFGRPVLAIVPAGSEAVAVVERWRCGVVADPDDPGDIARKVRYLAARPQVLAAMGRRAYEAARHYERTGLLKRFVELTEQQADLQHLRRVEEKP